MRINTASQRLVCSAINSDGFVTGEASNITGTVSIDGGTPAALNDTNPTELGSGRYSFDLTQAETNGYELVFILTCSTSGVMVTGSPGDVIYTTNSINGNGSETYIHTFTNSSGVPVVGVQCYVTSDSTGGTKVTGDVYSNNLGKVTFNLDPGTYYLWPSHTTEIFTSPITITVIDV